MVSLHRHHIVPRHMGGTDDPSNIILLTPTEHAEAHRILWEEYGKWQDYCAWKGLDGLDQNFDAASFAIREGAKMGSQKTNLLWLDPEYKAARVSAWKLKMEAHYRNGRKAEKNPNSREYEVTSPSGSTFVIKSLKTWCETNGLNYATFHQMCICRGKSHRGYTCRRLTPS